MPDRIRGTTVAVALMIVLAGCGAAVSPTSSPGPSPSQATIPPTPTSPPTPSTPSTSSTAGDWRPVPDQAAVQGGQFEHVVWTGTRFVATGTALGAEGAFLDSPDGLVWHRQPTAPAKAYPASLAAGPGGVVAIGTIDDRPASWFSTDGLTWTARADAFPVPTTGTDTFGITAVVATDGGWLAVGREDPYCNMNCGLAPVRAMVWTSRDGLHWARAHDQGSLGKAAMTGVARGGPGFVAVGLAGVDAAAWTSTDGSTWARVPDSPLFHELPSADPSMWTTMIGIAAGHGVVVAIGNEGPGGGHGPAARAWWSADGRTWARADGDYFASGGEISVMPTSVTATPEGFLATATTNGGCTGGIWASADGHAWRCVALDAAFAGFKAGAAAASSSVEVAVGFNGFGEPPSDGYPGAVWRRTVP